MAYRVVEDNIFVLLSYELGQNKQNFKQHMTLSSQKIHVYSE